MIPSTGRATLSQAIESAKSQNFSGILEVVVVFDLDPEKTSPEVERLAADADAVVFTGGGRKGGFARNLGVRHSNGDWIAFLDDDDTWHPLKITRQLQLAEAKASRGKRAIVGCRVQQVSQTSGPANIVSGIPAKLIGSGDRIEDYLFARRRPGAKRASFFTSTVFAARSICEEIAWDETLARHQDWDWLVRASKAKSVSVVQAEDVLVSIHVGSQGSISAGADWASSLAWADRLLRPLGPRVYVDFISAQTLRYALQKRDLTGIRLVLKRMLQSRCVPSIGPAAIGLAGAIPRKSLQWLMRKIR
ncbi:glycosyltransferase [Paenarthrobacter ureafaciens]|uniref:glycosyltransferase n=1 Tax=Paenarthrobacter ureafaciens TaxID=37931 RepID=UPI00398B9C14